MKNGKKSFWRLLVSPEPCSCKCEGGIVEEKNKEEPSRKKAKESGAFCLMKNDLNGIRHKYFHIPQDGQK